MLDDAIAHTRRLIESLERDAAELASAGVCEDNADGQRVIAAALAAARQLLEQLQRAST